MKRVAGAVVVVTLVACIAAAYVAAQGAPKGGAPKGGPGAGAMAAFMYLERTWTAVSFQLNCTGDQVTALKPTFRNALNARDAAIRAAMKNQDWAAMGKASTDCKTRLDAKLKAVLSKAQWAKLQQMMTPPAPPAPATPKQGGHR